MILAKSNPFAAMKRYISTIMLFAAAAMAFVSCQKQEMEGAEMLQVSGLTFTSEKPAFDDDTKTEWTGETIQWSKGDKIAVAYTVDSEWMGIQKEEEGVITVSQPKLYKSNELSETQEVANFNVSTSFNRSEEGIHVFYGVYPAPSSTDFSNAPVASLTIPTTQTPPAASFDSSADLMIAVSDEYDGIPSGERKISLRWTRLVAHANITLKELNGAVAGEKVETITLTAQEGANLVGNQKVNITTTEVTNNNKAPNVLVLNGNNLSVDANGNVEFWACFLPCTWTSLTVVVETDKATYTREITGISKTFKQNARNILSINMATAERVANAAAELPFVRDFSDKTGTGGITELDGFRVNGSVYNAAGAIRLAKGDGEGSITTQLLDISQDFQVRVTAKGWDSDELTLNVSAGDQSEDITLIAEDFVTYAVNFNAVSAASGVTFTAASGKRCYISKIEILAGHDELPPVLRANAPSQMAATGGEASFTYTLTNPKDGQEITAESNVAWISNIVLGEGTVTYSVAENTTEEAREGMITLSYEGIDDVAVTISQAAAAGEGGGESSGGYTVIKSVDELSEGTYIIGGNNESTYAEGTMYIWSDASNVSEQKLKTTAVNFSNNDFSSDVSSFVHIELIDASIENTYYIKVGAKYLKGAEKVWSLVDDPVAWTFADMPSGKDGMYFYNTSNVSYVSINSTTDAIRTYNSNTKYKGIYLFEAN